MGVSKNNGTPKSSISIGFSIINHPFWGTPIFGNIHILVISCYINLLVWITSSPSQKDRQHAELPGKFLRILQHTPWNIPQTRNQQFRKEFRNSFHLGVKGDAWGMLLSGYVGVTKSLLICPHFPYERLLNNGGFSRSRPLGR